ncbi:CBS domain-containing protein [gut metagenome]|uniref:CBS domain-containing protein n=1 Tax=gut metagenome TaxID=749906 RepID=J9FJN0_9ZZZZ
MEDFKLKHLPLVVDGAYRSLVSERELLLMANLSDPIGDQFQMSPFINESAHILEALGVITRYMVSSLPVVSADGLYQGLLTRERFVDALSELCCAEVGGTILVLEIKQQDYSLAEIARIVESNNAHVLTLFSTCDNSTGRMLITLKVDLEDASPVIRSFERFNYDVASLFMKRGVIDDILRQRMDEVLFYMNM